MIYDLQLIIDTRNRFNTLTTKGNPHMKLANIIDRVRVVHGKVTPTICLAAPADKGGPESLNFFYSSKQ